MRLQSAIFDMDGTLLDSMHIWDGLAAATLRELGYAPEPDLYEHVKRTTLREGAQYCHDRYRTTQSVDELVAITQARVEDFYRSRVQAKPGVIPFLTLLRMEDVSMYVATNTDRPLAEAALRHAGIGGFFRGLITCSEAGAGKQDSPAVYEKALRRLQGDKRSAIIFEDALHAIRTAKAAGFRVCGVYDPSAQEDQPEIRALADLYIRSFQELTDTQALR